MYIKKSQFKKNCHLVGKKSSTITAPLVMPSLALICLSCILMHWLKQEL